MKPRARAKADDFSPRSAPVLRPHRASCIENKKADARRAQRIVGDIHSSTHSAPCWRAPEGITAQAYPDLYKDFEVHPLAFSRAFDKFDGHKRHAEALGQAAARVRRPGAISGLEGEPCVSSASCPPRRSGLRRCKNAAASQYGADIIDAQDRGRDGQ